MTIKEHNAYIKQLEELYEEATSRPEEYAMERTRLFLLLQVAKLNLLIEKNHANQNTARPQM